MAAASMVSMAASARCRQWRGSDARVWSARGAQPCGMRCRGSWGGVLTFRVQEARRGVVAFARSGPSRTGKGPSPGRGPPARRIQKIRREDEDDDLAAEAALEALFLQLEKDLESESEDDDDGVEITEEEMAAFEQELEAALMGIDLPDSDTEEEEGEEDEEEEARVLDSEPGLVDMVMTDGVYGHADGSANGSSRRQVDDNEEDDDEEEEEEDRTVALEKWQLRKLAAAAQQGRRNVNVKSLAAELGMDRTDVLSFLRDPPPELLLMSASLDSAEDEDEDELAGLAAGQFAEATSGRTKQAPKTAAAAAAAPEKKPASKPAVPGGPQGPKSWHNNKRLRKEHAATFERVYRQSHRPSNAMIENLVVLTHVPRKKILQWFDDRRLHGEPAKSSFEDAPEA